MYIFCPISQIIPHPRFQDLISAHRHVTWGGAETRAWVRVWVVTNCDTPVDTPYSKQIEI